MFAYGLPIQLPSLRPAPAPHADPPPTFATTPQDIHTSSPDPSEPASYELPTALDSSGGEVAVTCDPAPGSYFPSGKTTIVTCTAVDAASNTAQVTFRVTVGALGLASRSSMRRISHDRLRFAHATCVRLMC